MYPTQQFICFYNDPNRFKGEKGWCICFLPTQDAFQMLCTFTKVVQSISFEDVQPAIFSPDNCADMKKEGAALLFWITSRRPANLNRFYLGVRLFLVLLPSQLHAQLKAKHAEALNLLATPDLLMMSDWAVPHQGDIIYYSGWHQWEMTLFCQSSLAGHRRTQLRFHLPGAISVWPWWNHCCLPWHHGTWGVYDIPRLDGSFWKEWVKCSAGNLSSLVMCFCNLEASLVQGCKLKFPWL